MILKNHLYELILQVHKSHVTSKYDKTEISQSFNETNNKILIKKLESNYLLNQLKSDKQFVNEILKITNKYRKEDLDLLATTKSTRFSFCDTFMVSFITGFFAFFLCIFLGVFSDIAPKIILTIILIFNFFLYLATIYNKIIYKKYKKQINQIVKKINLKDAVKNKNDYSLKIIEELELAEKDPNNKKFSNEMNYIKEFIVNEAFDFQSKKENEKEITMQKLLLLEIEEITDEKAKSLYSNSIETKLIKGNNLTAEEKVLEELFKIELTLEDKINILKKQQ